MGGLLKFADLIDRTNQRVGKVLSLLVLVLIVVQFALVVMSANFQAGSIKLQESLLYINSLLFLGSAGFALLTNNHVRVDIFYRRKSEKAQTKIDLLGHLVLLLPFMVFVWIIGLPFVLTSWGNMEGSFETSGLQIVYVLKSFFLVFALMLTLQAIAGVIRCIHKLRGGS
jgi:TRAP-type mannitol/chloroaromatic compound transport system permease small subunit